MPNQFLKLRRSAVQGKIPETSSLDLGELAINTYEGQLFLKKSGSQGEIVTVVGSTGSFTGSFTGNGAGLSNIPASGITGLNLSRIATGSISASVNTDISSSFRLTSGSNTLLNVTRDGQLWLGNGSFVNQGYQLDVNGPFRTTVGGNVLELRSNGFAYVSRMYFLGDALYNSSNQPSLGIGSRMYMEANTGIDFSWGNLVQGNFIFKTTVATNNSVGGTKPSFIVSHTLNDGASSTLGEFRSVNITDVINMTSFPLSTYRALFISPTIASLSTNVVAIQNVIGNNLFNTTSGSTGIGVSSINASAKLQIDSTTQGFLPTRTNSTASITSPAQGLLTYITASGDTEGLWQYRTGSNGWVQFLHNSSSIPASSIVGLNLSRIATGSVTASVGVGDSSFSIVSGSSTFLYASSSGNIGVNTSSPTAKLDVSGSSRFVGNTVITGSGNTSATNALTIVNSAGSALMSARNDGLITLNNDTVVGNRLHVENGILFNYGGGNFNRTILSNAGSNVTFRLPTDAAIYNFTTWSSNSTIFSLGDNAAYLVPNVGIGITSPTAKLDVSGSSRFVGNMVITGSSNNSSTNALSIVNSSNTSILTARNDGLVSVSSTFFVGTGTNGFTITNSTISNGLVDIRSDRLQMRVNAGPVYVYNQGDSDLASLILMGGRDGSNTQFAPVILGSGTNATLVRETMRVDNQNQSVLIGTVTNVTSSILTLNSTSKGFLAPRMTEAQRLAIATPAQGLMVYDTGSVTEGLWIYNSGSNPGWQEVLTNSGSQSISGSITANSITVTGTLTAQTIVAQTITSSTDFVTGSTRFGSLLSNTHQFTGSVSITGSLTLPYLNTGSILFAGATDNIAEDNANLFWDNTNKRLGIGINAPTSPLFVYTNTSSTTLGDNSGFILHNNNPSQTVGNLTELFFSDAGQGTGTANGLNLLHRYAGISGFITGWNSQASAGGLNFVTKATTGGSLTTKLQIRPNGNVIIQDGGTFLDGSQRLQVYGDTLIKAVGAGNTFAVQDSSANNLLSVRNDCFITIGASSQIGLTNSAFNSFSPSLNIFGFIAASSWASDGIGYWFYDRAASNTSGALVQIRLGGTGQAFQPTSGTATHTHLLINSTINQTGGANGITRGLYVAPTLTSAANWRSIEWSNNSGWGLYGDGSANNYLAGRLGLNSTSISNVTLRNELPISGSAFSFGYYTNALVQSGVTSQASYFLVSPQTQAASFTLSRLSGFEVASLNVGAGSTITEASAFYGGIASGSNRWNLYMNGTADNYLAGKLLIGTTSVGTYNLDVVGNGRFSGTACELRIAESSGIVSNNAQFNLYNSTNQIAGQYFTQAAYTPFNRQKPSQYNIFTNGQGGLAFSAIDTSTTATIDFLSKGFASAAASQLNMRITNNGNILINTETDSGFRLDVNGTARISGSLTINNAQFNNTSSLTSAGITTVSQLSTSSYTSCFYNYTVASASNARSGQVMTVWNGSTLTYTEVVTTDIGNTSQVAVSSSLSSGFVRLQVSASSGWTFKNISNLL